MGMVGEVPADSDGFALHMEFFSVDLEAGQKYQVDIKGKHSADEECEDDAAMTKHARWTTPCWAISKLPTATT